MLCIKWISHWIMLKQLEGSLTGYRLLIVGKLEASTLANYQPIETSLSNC